MIAQIRGHLIQKSPGSIIVEANGIGYQLFVSLTTFYDLPEFQQNVMLHTYTHVREDLLQLYGFSTPLEKELFQILISVSGIGPKLAINILSGISPSELVHSLGSRDMARLLSIPGVGRKTAERLLLDLQEKVLKIQSRGVYPQTVRPSADGMAEDVVSALVNLGYKRNQAEKAVESVLQQTPEITLEKALKESLRVLSTG
ncbi:MAG: Holliday junction branch migration protein RuvA [Thermodesulfobacteriota bacterium]|jgi:Holliday junction DNA helicase RuvA